MKGLAINGLNKKQRCVLLWEKFGPDASKKTIGDAFRKEYAETVSEGTIDNAKGEANFSLEEPEKEKVTESQFSNSPILLEVPPSGVTDNSVRNVLNSMRLIDTPEMHAFRETYEKNIEVFNTFTMSEIMDMLSELARIRNTKIVSPVKVQ